MLLFDRQFKRNYGLSLVISDKNQSLISRKLLFSLDFFFSHAIIKPCRILLYQTSQIPKLKPDTCFIVSLCHPQKRSPLST